MAGNPYQTPTESAVEKPDAAESRRLAVRRLRVATLIGISVPGVDYAAWFAWAFGRLSEAAVDSNVNPDLSTLQRSFAELAVLRGAMIVAALAAGWWIAYPIYRATCVVVRWSFCRHVPADHWQADSDDALWPIPYAAACGAILWVMYEHVFPYGWTNDIICGSLGHLLGAWCYLTVIASWVKTARRARARKVG